MIYARSSVYFLRWTFHSHTFINAFKTWFTSFHSFLFFVVVVHKNPASFFVRPVNLVAELPGLLDPLCGPHTVSVCAQRLWSSLTTYPAHHHLSSSAACETSFICVLLSMSALLVRCWSIYNTFFSNFLYINISDFFAVEWVPMFGLRIIILRVCTCTIFHFKFWVLIYIVG